MVARQKIDLGRSHAGQTVLPSWSPAPAMAVEFSDGETRAITRTTTQPVPSIKGQRPRAAARSS